MDYEEYKISRDLAWKIILDMGFTELPIKVSAICRKLGIQVRSYEKAKKLLKRHQLEHKTLEIDGFTLGIDGGTPSSLMNIVASSVIASLLRTSWGISS